MGLAGDIRVRLGADTSSLKSELKKAVDALKTVENRANLLGDAFDEQKATADALRKSINNLTRRGLDESNESLKALSSQYRQLSAEIKRAADSAQRFEKIKDITDKVRGIGQSLTMYLTAPLTAAAGATIKFASDLRETSDKLTIAFGSMTGQATEFANRWAAAMGRSQKQMKDFLADNQAMLSPMLENSKAAAAMSESISTLAVDLGSMFNKADADAMQAIRSGLVGETEPLRQFGVVLSEVTLKQEAYRLGLGKKVEQMSEAEKVALRYSLIMRQTSQAQGNAIQTGDSFANQVKSLQGMISDLATTIGQKLLPYGAAVVTWAKDMTTALSKISPETMQTLLHFAAVVAVTGPLISALASITQVIMGLSKAIAALGLVNLLTNPIAMTTAGVVALGAAFAYMGAQMGAFKPLIDLLKKIPGLGSLIKTVEGLSKAFKELGNVTSGVKFSPDKGLEEMRKMQSEMADMIRSMLKDNSLAGAGNTGLDTTANKVRTVSDVMADLKKQMQSISTQSALLGKDFDTAGARASALDSTIRELSDMGIKSTDNNLKSLVSQLRTWQVEVKKSEQMTASFRAEMERVGLKSTAWVQEKIFGDIKGSLNTKIQAQLRYIDEQKTKLTDEIIKPMLANRPELKGKTVDDVTTYLESASTSDSMVVKWRQTKEALAKANTEVERLTTELKKLDDMDQLTQQAGSELERFANRGKTSLEVLAESLDANQMPELAAKVRELIPQWDAYERKINEEKTALESLNSLIQQSDSIWQSWADQGISDIDKAIRDVSNAMTELKGKVPADEMEKLSAAYAQLTQLKGLQEGLADEKARRGTLGDWKPSEKTPTPLQTVIGGFGEVVKGFMDGAVNLFTNPIGTIKNAGNSIWDNTLSVGGSIVNGAASGILSGGQSIGQGWQQLTESLGKVLNPLQMFGDILNQLNPYAAFVQELMSVLGPSIQQLIGPVLIVADAFGVALQPVLKALFPVFKVLAQVALGVVQVFAALWNGLVWMFSWVPGVSGMAIDMSALADAQDALSKATWDNVGATQEQYKETHKLADATAQAAESMKNIPSGIKLAQIRYDVALPKYHTGGVPATDGLAMLRRDELVVTPEQQKGMGNNYNFYGPMYGYDDFSRKVNQARDQEIRSRGLSTRGLAGGY